MTPNNNDQNFCWERVLKSNCLFRVSHLFAPQQFAGQLLALHALFASIDQVHSEVSEEQVARKKLDWWRYELLPGNISKSRHPVVRQMHETGAASALAEKSLENLPAAAESRLDAHAPSDMAGLVRLCQDIYQPRMVLECALSGQDLARISDHQMMACKGGLLQLLRESYSQAERAFWWVPMNKLARFGVNRQELRENRDSEAARGVFREVLGVCHLPEPAQGPDAPMNLLPVPGLVHLQLLAILQARQLGQVQRKRPSSHRVELNRWRISDLFATWKAARCMEAKAPLA